MKRPSNALGTGLWVSGTLVGLYLLGFVLFAIDRTLTRGYYGMQLPYPIYQVAYTIYTPLYGPVIRLLFPP